MDREAIFGFLGKKYVSKSEMIPRLPLGVSPDTLWAELLGRRRAEGTVLPLYDKAGRSYWYVTTGRMIAASEKIIKAAFENGADLDPFLSETPVSTLEEVFYTSYVEGMQISMRDAMNFFTSDCPPRDIEEQLLVNNRQAANYAGHCLYRTVDTAYLKELVSILTDGMDCGGEYRMTDDADTVFVSGEAFDPMPARCIPERMEDLTAFLRDPRIHPLIKAAAAQAYLMILCPFTEGNERLARLLSSIILLRSGYTVYSDISLSALIARRNYGYYQAMENIFRKENGGDLTYFIEYYLEILSRAIDERALKEKQKEEQSLYAEREAARTPLTQPSVSTPAETPVPESANDDGVPDGFFTMPDREEQEREETDETDESISLGRVRRELYSRLKTSSGATRITMKYLISLMKEGRETFSTDDIQTVTRVTPKKASNIITRLRELGLIESYGRAGGKRMLYCFSRHLPPLGMDAYDPKVLSDISMFHENTKSVKDVRLGEMLYHCLPKGIITAEDYTACGEQDRIYNDMLLPLQMGLVEKAEPGVYLIQRNKAGRQPVLNDRQKDILKRLYDAFGTGTFMREEANAALDMKESTLHKYIHALVMLGILHYRVENGVYFYTLHDASFIDSDGNGDNGCAAFCNADASTENPGDVDDDPFQESEEEPDIEYAGGLFDQMKLFAGSKV